MQGVTMDAKRYMIAWERFITLAIRMGRSENSSTQILLEDKANRIAGHQQEDDPATWNERDKAEIKLCLALGAFVKAYKR